MFLKGTVGDEGFLFDIEQIMQFLYSVSVSNEDGLSKIFIFPQYSSHHRIHLLIVRP